MCHRGGFLSFPKVLNDFKVFGVTFDGDLPIDGLITNLFETACTSSLRFLLPDNFIFSLLIFAIFRFLSSLLSSCRIY